MAKIEWLDGSRSIEIESAHAVPMSHRLFAEFDKRLRAFIETVNLTSLTFTKNVDGDFEYHFDTANGREWNQTIRIANSSSQTEADMNFDVSDFFTLTEFKPHRDVRLSLIMMAMEWEIISIEVSW